MPGASAPDLVILELPSLVAVPRVASVARVVVLGGTSSVAVAVPLFPLPSSATGASGQLEVALPLEAAESLVQPPLAITAFAPSRDALLVLLGEGHWDHPSSSLEASRENAEEWECIQSASSRAYMSLETIERMLGRFKEVVTIARASMMWDFIGLLAKVI